MLIELLIVLAGIAVIIALAQIIIKNAIDLANYFGFSGTFIGLTVLSIGTSIPEIMTNIIGSVNILKDPSAINTFSGLVIGNSIGSDIFQQSFILPLVGIIGTVVVIKKNLLPEVGGLIGAALLTWVFSLGGIITRLEGFILVFAYISYVIYLKQSRIGESFNNKSKLKLKEIVWATSLVLASFLIMAFVANQVLDASTKLISVLPISASFFGVIFLGIASALPELTTSLVAISKGKKDISAGILIGSNITNPLLGIGLGALISTYTIPNVIVLYDLPLKIATALLIYYFLMKGKNLTKSQAITLMIIYFVYLAIRVIFFPVDF